MFDLIVDRVPATLLLMVTAIAWRIVLGVLLGVAAARRSGGWLDSVGLGAGAARLRDAAVLARADADRAVLDHLGVLPSGGMMTIGTGMSAGARALDIARHCCCRRSRSALFYARGLCAPDARLDARGLHATITSRRRARRGCRKRASPGRMPLRNALLPVVTLAGVQIGHLLGGSILVETVFGWPGLGRLVFDALLQRDLNCCSASCSFVGGRRAGQSRRSTCSTACSIRGSCTNERAVAAFWAQLSAATARRLAAGGRARPRAGAALVGPLLYPVDPFDMVGRPSEFAFGELPARHRRGGPRHPGRPPPRRRACRC